MGEYGFDTIVRALELGPAEQVYASSTELFPVCYPVASTLHYRFPVLGSKPAVESTGMTAASSRNGPLNSPLTQ
jgi:hypothetical protein